MGGSIEGTLLSAAWGQRVGSFARINFACNTRVALRVQTFPSCNAADNCKRCQAPGLSQADRTLCFEMGCSCFGGMLFMFVSKTFAHKLVGGH